MQALKVELPEETTTQQLIDKIEELNRMRMSMVYCCSIRYRAK
jgi:hypothetical protein